MKQVKVITAQEAALLVKDNDVVASNGFVGSVQPEALTSALEARFLETGAPRDLTLIYAVSQGNSDGRGGDHFAHEGMLKKAILGHWNAVTALQKLVNANKIQAYNLLQGTLAQYFRDVAETAAVGIPAEVVHRIAAMASGGMDSLPHNGAVITTLAICGLTHREAYKDMFAITLIKIFVAFFAVFFYMVTGII